ADGVRPGGAASRSHGAAARAPAPPPPPPPPQGPAATPPQAPPPASPPAPAPLASFPVRSGALIGQRLQVKTPVANIGRADYNDLVIPDPSVSTSHAKLQRREGVWVLVDLESTNGSFVDGERVKGDAPLAPGAMVRLGDVQLVFEPTDDALGVVKGGGTQILRTPHSIAPTPAAPASAAPAAPAAPPARPAPPAASKAAPPRPRPAAAKPAASKPGAPQSSKRPAAQQPPAKQGQGCGGSAAVRLLRGAG